MAAAVLSPVLLRAQLAALSKHLPADESPVVAFHGDHAWNGGPQLQVDAGTWSVLASRSPLQIRDTLASRLAGAPPLVLLTPLSPAELGADVMARLVRRRLLELDAWEPVLRAFGTARLDGRLAQQRWMADALLTGMPADGYPQVASGTLDAATAWRHVLRSLLGVDAAAIDVATLLEWSLDGAVVARWEALSDFQRRALLEWVGDQAGAAARLLAGTLASGSGRDLVALGIVCGALFAEDPPSGAAREAAIRLERLTAGAGVDPVTGRAWAEAAQATVARLVRDGQRQASEVLTRADDLLRQVGGESIASLSRWSPVGYGQRLDTYGVALRGALESDEPAEALARAADALSQVAGHERSRIEPERLTRTQHALRLARYVLMTRDTDRPSSFAQAVRAYQEDDAYADIARTWLASSEPSPVLAGALSLLSGRVVAAREQLTAHFARLLQGWFATPSAEPGMVPVEGVLQTVVGPLAGVAPVLLLVVDGMSMAVADALVGSIQSRGWVSVLPVSSDGGLAAVAALPSVTEVCRTSLLCGALRTGASADERTGFSGHAALVARSKPGKSPRLFHKAELGAGTGLSSEVADALADRDQRIVGVVINAVDDHLLKDDMVRPQWTLEYVPIVGALVDAARSAGRVVVLTSDHGHLLDLGLTEKTSSSPADRYRSPSGNVGDGELAVSGPRVIAATDSIVVATSERIRYGKRKNGYHGGGSLQEVVVPLHILALEQSVPEGYSERLMRRPAWWDLDARMGEGPASVAPSQRPGPLPLFDDTARRPPVVVVAEEPRWLDALLASPVFAEQKSKALRVGLPDARLRAILSALAGRGGRMTVAAAAERMGVSAGRVTSMVAAAGQLVNFDGYQSLFVDGDDVVLDVPVLTSQFLISQ